MRNVSTWQNEVKIGKSYPKLLKDLTTEVVVVGGGLTGIACAYLLAKQGKKVVVVDKDWVGAGVSAFTTAFITQDIDTDLVDLVELYGKREAKEVWRSGECAINLIERIVKDEKIDCDFKRCNGYLFITAEDEQNFLKDEEKIASRMGFKVGYREDKRLGFENCGYLEIANQAKFQPLKYIKKLAEVCCKRYGVKIYEGSEVLDIEDNEVVVVRMKNGNTIHCHDAIEATYQPLEQLIFSFPRNSDYLTYVVEIEMPKLIREGIYWDTKNPYNYFRVEEMGRYSRVILGGADHKSVIKTDADKKYHYLINYFKERVPGVKFKVVNKWNSLIIETLDGLPYIGRLTKYSNQYVATGFSGNGMTYSHVGAMLISDLILGRKSSWEDIYRPSRIPTMKQVLRKGYDYTQEFIKGVFLR